MIRRLLESSVVVTMLCSLLPMSGAASASAQPALSPRVADAKPSRTVRTPWHDARRLVVKLAEGTDLRLQKGSFVSPSGQHPARGLNEAVRRYGASVERQFPHSDEDLARLRTLAEARRGRRHADLTRYFEMTLADPAHGARLADELNALGVVELAWLRTVPAPAPDFSDEQGYTDPAPQGVDSDAARLVPGGDGSGRGFSNDVRIVDIERNWLLDHEDLGLDEATTLVSGVRFDALPNDENHGTQALGVLVARDNGVGVTGMVPGASVRVASKCRSVVTDGAGRAQCVEDEAETIVDATMHLRSSPIGAGVILLETQARSVDGRLVPSEIHQDVFDAVALAVDAGIVVVSAAGNGAADLDAFRTPANLAIFDRTVRDSGAIVVGAACAPPAGCARSASGGSNFGSRVDLQGWGNRVVTTGTGDRAGDPGEPEAWYTNSFSGTSSASAIVAGAAAALQGMTLGSYERPLDPVALRAALVADGTPQPAENAAFTPIGPQPNLGPAAERAQRSALFRWWMIERNSPDFPLLPRFVSRVPCCVPANYVPATDAVIDDAVLRVRSRLPEDLAAVRMSATDSAITIHGSMRKAVVDPWTGASTTEFTVEVPRPAGSRPADASVRFDGGVLTVVVPLR